MTDREKTALTALLDYRQADEEGIMVLAYRQAIHEVCDYTQRLEQQAARAKRVENERDKLIENLEAENKRLRARVSELEDDLGKVYGEVYNVLDNLNIQYWKPQETET